MSRLSGRCDLYDHVYMIGSKETTPEMSKQEKFNVFKKRTGGVIYQAIEIDVTKNNIDMLIENNKFLEKTPNGYSYFGKEYKTLKSLNKAYVTYNRKILFDNMLDLVPYLPYIISMMTSDEHSEYIQISKYSSPYLEYLESLNFGNDRSEMLNYYNKRLIEEYIDTINTSV